MPYSALSSCLEVVIRAEDQSFVFSCLSNCPMAYGGIFNKQQIRGKKHRINGVEAGRSLSMFHFSKEKVPTHGWTDRVRLSVLLVDLIRPSIALYSVEGVNRHVCVDTRQHLIRSYLLKNRQMGDQVTV